ncbi:unnamed protein product, partial [Iphiclides podalirius]
MLLRTKLWYVSGDLPYQTLPTGKGKRLIVLQGHTFSVQGRNPEAYYCSAKYKTGCRARVRLCYDVIVHCELNHNHPPPILHRAADGTIFRLHLEFITPTNCKKRMLIVQNHTFAQTTNDRRYWNCSKKLSNKCPAKLRFDSSGRLVYYVLKHNHQPPRFYRDKRGNYDLVAVAVLEQDIKPMQSYGQIEFNKLQSDQFDTIRSIEGKQLVVCHGFVYSRCSPFLWRCSSASPRVKCPARIKLEYGTINRSMSRFRHVHAPPKFVRHLTSHFADDSYEVIRLRKGKQLIFHQGFTYFKRTKFFWLCSSKGCLARVRVEDGEINRSLSNLMHAHEKPTLTDDSYEIIRSRKGNRLILYQGFTYFKRTKFFWQCSSSSVQVRCPARIRVEGGTINRSLSDLTHVHKRPNFLKLHGEYIRA